MKSILSSLLVSLGLSIALLIYGLNYFRSEWMYSEIGHGYLATGIITICILLFLTLRMSKIFVSILLLLAYAVTLTYSTQKFEWRKDYIQSAENGRYFALESYIENYPTFEEHTFSSFMDTPQWVDFSRDCYEPLLKRNPSSEPNNKCQTQSAIQENYNISVPTMINDYYSRMVNTAKQIEKQRFKTKAQLEGCIESKRCAMIPLLPEGTDVVASSNDYLDIRDQFWSLINDKHISAQNCDYFDLCRVMTKAGIYRLPKS